MEDKTITGLCYDHGKSGKSVCSKIAFFGAVSSTKGVHGMAIKSKNNIKLFKNTTYAVHKWERDLPRKSSGEKRSLSQIWRISLGGILCSLISRLQKCACRNKKRWKFAIVITNAAQMRNLDLERVNPH